MSFPAYIPGTIAAFTTLVVAEIPSEEWFHEYHKWTTSGLASGIVGLFVYLRILSAKWDKEREEHYEQLVAGKVAIERLESCPLHFCYQKRGETELLPSGGQPFQTSAP